MDYEDNLQKGWNKLTLIYFQILYKSNKGTDCGISWFSIIEDDLIELFKTIKLLIYDSIRADYPRISITETLSWLINIKQGMSENVVDFLKGLDNFEIF